MLPAYPVLSKKPSATATLAVDQTESSRVLVSLVEHSCLCFSTHPLLVV